jgi:hypothetical protein
MGIPKSPFHFGAVLFCIVKNLLKLSEIGELEDETTLTTLAWPGDWRMHFSLLR